MEQGLVPHAANRDAAQFLDSYRHGAPISVSHASDSYAKAVNRS